MEKNREEELKKKAEDEKKKRYDENRRSFRESKRQSIVQQVGIIGCPDHIKHEHDTK